MRRLAFLVTLMMLLAAIPAGASSHRFPDVIPLPDGFQPEGVTVGAGHEIYAGSLVDGSIYRADLRTGAGEIVVPGAEGRVAVGLDYDDRSGYLFVAGGPTGKAFVYDTDTGTMVAEFDLAPGFINDVIVTRTAAYFTNSFAAEIYAVPLERNGSVAGDFATIPLGGDFQFVPDNFNANGIEATPNGGTLMVVNSTTGELYTVDPATGDAALIDLDGASVASGDGVVLVGKTLYVVQNFLNQVAEIQLSPDLESGEVVDILTSSDFRIPTTADVFGKSLYVVNARFDITPTPDTQYEIIRLDR